MPKHTPTPIPWQLRHDTGSLHGPDGNAILTGGEYVDSGEQYQGFKQLPAAIEVGPSMTLEAAAQIVAKHASCADRWQPMMAAVDTFRTCYRAGVIRLHPDSGSPAEGWTEFQRAAEMLKKHHRIA